MIQNQIAIVALVMCILTFSCSIEKKESLQKVVAVEGANRTDISKATAEVNLASIKLPEKFKIDVWAADVPNARSLARSEEGIVFAGSRGAGKVYAIIDADADGKADYKYTLAEELTQPNGVAYKDGDLYVAEKRRILKFSDIKNNLVKPSFEVVFDGFPDSKQHGHKFIAFGPDGYLYVPVGAPCNICDPEEDIFSSVTRIDVNAENIKPEIVARGIRNTVGFDWHPDSKNLWFTDNNRDMLGDDLPSCELNEVTATGQHFGYPYWHAGDVKDPEFGDDGKDQATYRAPKVNLGAHVAPLGMRFYEGSMFPERYNNSILIAEHGSWNRSKKVGYNVTMASLNRDGSIKEKAVFAEGWLDEASQDVWGRPMDVMDLPDGSLLVSDDLANCIYRITYDDK